MQLLPVFLSFLRKDTLCQYPKGTLRDRTCDDRVDLGDRLKGTALRAIALSVIG
jgi:hypothetical protein